MALMFMWLKERIVEKKTSAVVRDVARCFLVHMWKAENFDLVFRAAFFVACFFKCYVVECNEKFWKQ